MTMTIRLIPMEEWTGEVDWGIGMGDTLAARARVPNKAGTFLMILGRPGATVSGFVLDAVRYMNEAEVLVREPDAEVERARVFYESHGLTWGGTEGRN